MILATHTIIYSKDAAADRAFLRDTLQLKHVDAGDGWLIFALPPAEVAVHPSDTGGKHELYFVVESVEAFVGQMNELEVPCSDISDEGWGRLVAITLPGGGEVGVYEPRHPLAVET